MTAIMHRNCGGVAFNYSRDTSPGNPIYAEQVVDIPAEAGQLITCKSCGCLIVNHGELYPDESTEAL